MSNRIEITMEKNILYSRSLTTAKVMTLIKKHLFLIFHTEPISSQWCFFDFHDENLEAGLLLYLTIRLKAIF